MSGDDCSCGGFVFVSPEEYAEVVEMLRRDLVRRFERILADHPAPAPSPDSQETTT